MVWDSADIVVFSETLFFPSITTLSGEAPVSSGSSTEGTESMATAPGPTF